MSSMLPSMIGGFVATLILVWVLAYLFALSYIRTMPTAPSVLAFIYWLGFIATTMSNMVWYEKKSWKLYAINVAHYLVATLVAAAVCLSGSRGRPCCIRGRAMAGRPKSLTPKSASRRPLHLPEALGSLSTS